MPFKPLVLLHRLAPEAINHLICPNQTPPAVVDQLHRNDQIFQNDEENNTQQPEKDNTTNSSVLPLKSQQELSCSIPKTNVLKSNVNDVKHDTKLDTQQEQHETLSNEPKHENSSNDYGNIKISDNSYIKVTDFFNKQLIVVIDDCFNEVIKDMVNSTAQHPKTRNPTNSTVATNSNNTATSTNSTVTTRDSTVAKSGHIIDESVPIMASKSPLSTGTPALEVIDKETKEDLVNNQQSMTAEELSKEANDKAQLDSSGLNLRTRTISSTTIPTNLHQSTVSTETLVPSICSTSTIITPRPRGRPPLRKNLIHIANRKKLQQAAKQVEESKICDLTSAVLKRKTAAFNLQRLHQKQKAQNKCNGINNYDHDQENSSTNFASISGDANNKRSNLSSDINKNKKCVIIDLTCKKKSIIRKRKQSDIGDVIPKKRHLVSNNLKDSSVREKIPTEKSSSLEKPNIETHYGFLAGRNTIEPYYSRFGSNISTTCSSISYGRTYWPANWEYSASALTGHVQKKASKDSLRKIRLLCTEGATPKINSSVSTPLKTISALKKHQSSALQRRGSASKLMALPSIEAPGGSKHSTSPTIVKRKKGRPPGRKNKLIQSVLKSNSPRKSPRQHASTLAAIKTLKRNKLLAQQSDKLLDIEVESNQNTLDMDGPCILKIAVPNYEHVRRRRRQLDHQHGIIKRRRRRRSITPPPPKLCAQQPAPQRISTNDSVDHEVVKLRTKHVDVVRRRARDERLRAAFICQQLRKVQEIAEQNCRNLAQENLHALDENELGYNALLIDKSQDQIWSSLGVENDCEPDNMCLQIMYEQTTDKRFLCTNLTDEALQLYHQQRDLALAERLTFNYYGDSAACDLGTDMISATNKRKKKRPNMTGWPKEKRRKVIATTSSIAIEELNGDSEVEREEAAKRRRAAAAKQQKLRRQRIKLEQQQQAKEKNKAKGVASAIPKRRPGRRPGPLKKKKTTTYRRRKTSVSSNDTTVSSNSTTTTIKEKKLTVPRKRRKRIILQNKTVTPVSVTNVEPNTVVKRSCGRPKGSVGKRRRWKLQDQTSSSPEQHKENVIQPQISSGKLKCVISTRNNRMKLLPTSSSSHSTTSNLKKTMSGNRAKKSTVSYNLTSSCLEPLSSPVTPVGKTTRTTVKKRRLQHQQMSSNTWDVGRPKRYHSANHGRNTNSVHVEEDCCFVGSQPFEQHCPGVGGGLTHNTVLENQQDQKENTVSIAGL